MQSLKDIAYDVIKNRILNCEIQGGERIREDLLAEDLNISRTPVREAINLLIMEGLVKNIPRKELHCVEITTDEIHELCDMRKIYEIYAIKRSIEHCEPEHIEELENLAKEFERNSQRNQPAANIDVCLHGKIIHIAGNSKLTSVYSQIANFLHIMTVMTEKKNPKIRNSEFVVEQHYQLVNSIRNKNEAQAIALIENHIDDMRMYLAVNGK